DGSVALSSIKLVEQERIIFIQCRGLGRGCKGPVRRRRGDVSLIHQGKPNSGRQGHLLEVFGRGRVHNGDGGGVSGRTTGSAFFVVVRCIPATLLAAWRRHLQRTSDDCTAIIGEKLVIILGLLIRHHHDALPLDVIIRVDVAEIKVMAPLDVGQSMMATNSASWVGLLATVSSRSKEIATLSMLAGVGLLQRQADRSIGEFGMAVSEEVPGAGVLLLYSYS
ncbi:hypothetical protein EJB05_18041, partial [Eragrostis curvula]